MKKFILLVLVMFYLGVSSGLTVNIHYCMGELIGWSMNDENDSGCTNCGMAKAESGKCCKDQQHKLEVKESLKASAIVFHFNMSDIEVPLAAFLGLDEVSSRTFNTYNYFSHASRRTPDSPVFLRNCSFRI
ncbi:MAG: hypothetical protein V4721_00095 [Bacteroidota bacterium]